MKRMNYDDEAAFRSSQTTVNSLTALHVSKEGLSLIGAAVFIIGEMAGSALPKAVSLAGWWGLFMVVFCAIISAHASVYLADCWTMVEEKWPNYKTEKTRNPFAVIGERACGGYMKIVCSFFMDIQLFGVCVVFLIFCSQLTKDFYDTFMPKEYHFQFCLWIILFGLILIPMSWAGSPHDFTWIAYSAMSCTVISCILVVFVLLGEGYKIKDAVYEGPTMSNFALAFGTILFVYGGTCTFPTFQNDMKEKSKFPKAVYLGFLGMLLIYVPIAGGGCQDSILDNFEDSDPIVGKIKTIINFLMAFHLFCAYLICLNPLNLDIENVKMFNIKHSFNFKRCVFRTCMTLLIIFVALSVPQFGKILNFVGAFSVSAVAYVLTPLFYIKLCGIQTGSSQKREIPSYRMAYLIFLVILGTTGGAISTYYSLNDMLNPASYTKPCYIHFI